MTAMAVGGLTRLVAAAIGAHTFAKSRSASRRRRTAEAGLPVAGLVSVVNYQRMQGRAAST
jgi:hypothetical protein